MVNFSTPVSSTTYLSMNLWWRRDPELVELGAEASVIVMIETLTKIEESSD